MSVTVHHGDMLEVLPTLGGFHSCVTDPPYHLTSIVKRFGADNAAAAKVGKSGAYARASAGFMGQRWDGGDIAFRPETWRLVYDALLPGSHLVAFGAPRNYHRMACAIEDAGFEIRDSLMWIFGSGFPKSHSVGKAIDKHNGDERPVTGSRKADDIRGGNLMKASQGLDRGKVEYNYTSAASAASAAWEGWGTALKPAYEPIILARKPLIGTVAANVLKHGTGALNIDGCRVAAEGADLGRNNNARTDGTSYVVQREAMRIDNSGDKGRWPANVVHDGSDEVVRGFPQTQAGEHPLRGGRGGISTSGHSGYERDAARATDAGSAARYFYTAKADAADRLGSKHPTVKPVDLMRWLVRLVTPPGGTLLDPFAGSGTTGMACLAEGFDAVLIEREAQYVADIRRRIAHVSGQDAPLFAEPAA